MTNSTAKKADAYYAAKDTYTELLHRAASDLPPETSNSPTPHAPTDNTKENDSWILQGQKEIIALAQLVKDAAAFMRDTKSHEEQPEDPDSNTNSKDKKK